MTGHSDNGGDLVRRAYEADPQPITFDPAAGLANLRARAAELATEIDRAQEPVEKAESLVDSTAHRGRMDLVPESRVLLGVDVIGWARNPGEHLNPLWLALARMLDAAFRASGIRDDELVDVELAGDGALYTLPTSRLGTTLDFSQRLDQLAAEHNRWHKPEIRLRIAVEMGAVGDQPGYYAPKIYRSRLLNAPAFKRLVERCMAERGDGAVNSGLIVSGHVYREVFGGDYTQLVRPGDFAELGVTEKEFSERTWVRVPGFDARSLTAFVTGTESRDKPDDTSGGMRVTNRVHGDMHGVQAGIVHGDITFGR